MIDQGRAGEHDYGFGAHGAGDTAVTDSGSTAPHALTMEWEGGVWSASVACPHVAMGAERPCAVWRDGDGTTRDDACTFQQYAEDVDLDEWLHGRIVFPPVRIVEGGSGDDWHAVVRGG